MNAIVLDARQAAALAHGHELVAVRDIAGRLLGHFAPSYASYGGTHDPEGAPAVKRNGQATAAEQWKAWFRECEEQDFVI